MCDRCTVHIQSDTYYIVAYLTKLQRLVGGGAKVIKISAILIAARTMSANCRWAALTATRHQS